MRYLFYFSLICLMSCSAFKKQEGEKMVKLSSTSWILDSIVGFELEPTPEPITLIFLEGNKVGGNTGCNGYGGPYTLEKNQLSFGMLIATKKACLPGMQTEIRFFEVLEQTNHYELTNNRLILKNGAVELATFSKAKN